MMRKRPVLLFLLLAVNSLTEVSHSKSLKGCINSVRSSTSKPNKNSHDPDDEVLTSLKRSSLKEGCEDDEENRPQVTREKNKIKRLQTSIHKNLIKLFHKLKSAKPGSVMPDRKEFTNFAEPANQNGKSGNAVSTGIPLSKVRDGINNITQFQDMNNTSTLKALDKLVGAVLPNMSSLLNNSNPQRADDADGGSGSGTEPNELQKNKSDPYAAIAAGPDHPKLPPDLKITPGGGSDGEAPPVVPVGMSDDSKTGGTNDEGHGPTPEEPSEAPSQNEDKDNSEEPDNPMVKQMQAQAMQVIQEQMQNQFKAAMQAAKGMPGMSGGMGGMAMMGGMGGMQSMNGGMGGGMGGGMDGGMDSMGGMGGMGGGMDMGGMNDMGSMGGMAGFGGMGDMGMAGMYGNRMAEMAGMGDFAGNAYQRDSLRGSRESFGEGNPFYPRGLAGGFRAPMGPMYPMVDESAVGRDKVPVGYEGRELMPYVRPFRRHRYFSDDDDLDDDVNDDDDEEDEPYFVPARERAAFDEPLDEGAENEMDDGYDAPYERKTKIEKVEKPKKKSKVKHTSHKRSKAVKGHAKQSKKHFTQKRGKTAGVSTDAVTPEMFYNSAMKQMQQQAMSAIEKQMQNQFASAWKGANGMGAKMNMGGGNMGGGMAGMMGGTAGMNGMAGMGLGMGGMNQMQGMLGKGGGGGRMNQMQDQPQGMGPMPDMPGGQEGFGPIKMPGGFGPMNDMPGGLEGMGQMNNMLGGQGGAGPMNDMPQGLGGMGSMQGMPGGPQGNGPMQDFPEYGGMGGFGGGNGMDVQDPSMQTSMGNGLFKRVLKNKANRKDSHKKTKITKGRKGSHKMKHHN